MKNTFKPIIDPLKKLVENVETEKQRNPFKNEIEPRLIKPRKLHFKPIKTEAEANDHEMFNSPIVELSSENNNILFSTPNNFSGLNRTSPINKQSLSESNPDIAAFEQTSSFNKQLLSESNRDTVYGPYYDPNTQTTKIGKCSFEMNDDVFKIDDENFNRTIGLTELILKKKPRKQVYTIDDLHQYHKILQKTSAHMRNYDDTQRITSNRGSKYTQIIKKLISESYYKNRKTGKSYTDIPQMTYTNKNSEYVYWNDPNELVSRLRLLIASTNAGNNNHQNEITSIIEELKESNIIY